LATHGFAQTTANIEGTVRDAQGLVIPGVAVIMSGAAVLGEQTTITVEDGTYRFRALRPGTYDLHFELAGFNVLDRLGIVVEGNKTLTVNVTLEVATVTETITVSGESPLVDVKNTSLTNQFDTAELQDVPSATDTWSVLAQTPGVRMRSYDVGGSHKGQQSGYESFGVRSQNRVLSEGVDSTEGPGAAGFYYNYYSIEEFTTSAAGADVEMTSGGSMIVMTIKSGGNELSGLFHADYEGEGFVSDNVNEELESRGYTGNPTLLFYELHGDLGGPIIRDKTWFYGFFGRFKIDKQVSGVDPAVGTSITTIQNFGGKLTFKLSERDQLIGYSQWQEKKMPNRNISAVRPPESTAVLTPWAWVHKAEWQRIWSDRAFSTVQVKHYGIDASFEPKLDPTTDPPRVDTATGVWSGAYFKPGFIRRWKPQLTATLNYYLPAKAGSHDIKIGLDWQIDSSGRGSEGKSGSIVYFDNSKMGRPHNVNEIQLVNEPIPGVGQMADDRNRHTDVFAQDTWVLSNRLTLLLGLRFGHQKTYYMDSVLHPEQADFFPTGVIPGQDVITWTTWAPRVGVTYDLTGAGKTILKGHYGRYYDNAADIFFTVNPAGIAFWWYKFLDPNQNGLYDGPHELGPVVRRQGTVLGDDLDEIKGTAYNPNLDAGYVDEFGASLEHQLWDATSLRFSYVHKQRRKTFNTWNRAQVLPLLEEGVPCGDAAFPCPADPFTGEPITTLERVPSGAAFAQDPVIDTFPGGTDRFDYDTVQVAFSRRFKGRFFLQGSFDYQWRNEPRNADGDSRNPLIVDPIGVWFFQNHNPAVSNKQKNTSWGARLLGRYVLPADVAVSANIRHQSGWPWAPIHRVNVPGSGTQPFFLEDLKNNRSDNVTIIDFRLEKAFQLGRRARLTGLFDVYNLFNSNPETNFVVRTGRNFQNIIAVLDPRVLKIGVRLQF
jgi:hypothetical protein